MDDLEARIAALELLIIEDLALRSPDHLRRMLDAIAEGLEHDISADERMVREGALQLVEDAARRFETFIGAPASPPAENDG